MRFRETDGLWVRDGELGAQDFNVISEVLHCNCYRTDLRSTIGEGECVIDVGAHIGCFATLWHRKNPLAKIACVEVCPENIPVLMANVSSFATVHQAACTYVQGSVILLNSIKMGGTATGGSIVNSENNLEADLADNYWRDLRPIRKITLEELLSELGGNFIHVLKLDCESSEFSILENNEWIDANVWFIVGEYHGRERWDELRNRKYSHWHFGDMKGGDLGIFHLANPRFLPG